MSDLERLDEALTWDLEYVAAIAKGDPDLTFEPLEVIVNAARAYRDLLANGPDRLNEPLKAFKRIDNEMDAPEDWVTVEEALNAYRDYLADPVAAAAKLDGAERRLRQFVFDIVMTECGMDESDPDDQADASERVDAWMEHWHQANSLPDKETP